MKKIRNLELGVRIGLKIFDIVTDLMINRKSKITYCPICKIYRVDGAIWQSDPKDLKGYELARTIIRQPCREAIEKLKVKIEIRDGSCNRPLYTVPGERDKPPLLAEETPDGEGWIELNEITRE